MKLRRALCLLMAALLLCGAGVALADSLVSESFAGRWGRELVNENVAGIDAALSAAARAGSGARVYDLAAGDTLSLGAGASALLLSGSASMSAEGTVVNVSEGAGSEGGSLSANELYVLGGTAGAVVSAGSAARVAVWGQAEKSARSRTFSDVPVGVWYYDYVYAAVDAGLVDGMSDTIFEPESGFTVAQAIKIAACLNQYLLTGKVTLTGDPELWYRSYVSYAVEAGIAGSEYASMGPDAMNARIDRCDFAQLFYNATPVWDRTAINRIELIPDVPLDSEGAAAIYALYRAGILNGMTADGRYNPDSGIRRNEAATIVARIINESLRVQVSM